MIQTYMATKTLFEWKVWKSLVKPITCTDLITSFKAVFKLNKIRCNRREAHTPVVDVWWTILQLIPIWQPRCNLNEKYEPVFSSHVHASMWWPVSKPSLNWNQIWCGATVGKHLLLMCVEQFCDLIEYCQDLIWIKSTKQCSTYVFNSF